MLSRRGRSGCGDAPALRPGSSPGCGPDFVLTPKPREVGLPGSSRPVLAENSHPSSSSGMWWSFTWLPAVVVMRSAHNRARDEVLSHLELSPLCWPKNHVRRTNSASPRVTPLGGGFYPADRARLRILGQSAATAGVLAGWETAVWTNDSSTGMTARQKQESAQRADSKLKNSIFHINKMPPREFESLSPP